MSLATPEAFEKDPSTVWQFYHYRRETAFKAQPNAAHDALAWLSVEANRKSVAPGSTDFTIITQNVDGLSPRAASTLAQSQSPPLEPASLQSNIIEMHGRIADTICTVCNHKETNFTSPICEGLRGTEDYIAKPDAELDDGPKVKVEDLPRCKQPGCGGMLRPGVVWFGEPVTRLEEIGEIVEKADLCLVVGTSSTVYPAAGLAYVVQQQGGKVAVFNLDRSEGDTDANFLFLGPCEETLPKRLGL